VAGVALAAAAALWSTGLSMLTIVFFDRWCR
jgi:hypothetical protein